MKIDLTQEQMDSLGLVSTEKSDRLGEFTSTLAHLAVKPVTLVANSATKIATKIVTKADDRKSLRTFKREEKSLMIAGGRVLRHRAAETNLNKETEGGE